MAQRVVSIVSKDSAVREPQSREPLWACRLIETCGPLAGPLPSSERDRLRGEAWILLRTALTTYIRHHAGQLGTLSRETVEDLAAEKTFDLLHKSESGSWNVSGWVGPQVAAFVYSVARNGVVDHLRAAGPRRLIPLEGDIGDDGPERVTLGGVPSEDPEVLVEATEYATHLARVVTALKPRARLIWFLRVFFDWPSKRIADHPDVRMPASHVDVELQRTRTRVRAWMESAGFDVHEIPAGTFASLWHACSSAAGITPAPIVEKGR
jgi:DNA-directed RNA polymerase specialized sigma24 family protein